MEVIVGRALESLEGLLEIRLGFARTRNSADSFKAGLAPWTGLDELLILGADLAAGEAAQKIEPGEISGRSGGSRSSTTSPLRTRVVWI